MQIVFTLFAIAAVVGLSVQGEVGKGKNEKSSKSSSEELKPHKFVPCPVYISFDRNLDGQWFKTKQFDEKRRIPQPVKYSRFPGHKSAWFYRHAGLRIPKHAVSFKNESTVCITVSERSENYNFAKILSTNDGRLSIFSRYDTDLQLLDFQFVLQSDEVTVTRFYQVYTEMNDDNYFGQFCLTYDGAALNVYTGKGLTDTLLIGGLEWAPFSKSGFLIGGDLFNGFIEKVLICEKALTLPGIIAVYDGTETLQKAGLIL